MANMKVKTLRSDKKVSAKTQARVRSHLTEDFFVVRTTRGDAVGCVVAVGRFSILMRLFIAGRFQVFRIPYSIIFDAFPFPCR